VATDQITFKSVGTALFGNSTQPVQLTRVTSTSGFKAFVFQCGMNKDVDGAPTCYGPHHPPAIEFIGNATNQSHPVFDCHGHNTWQWVGLYSRTRHEALDIRQNPGEKVEDIIDTNPCFEDVNHRFPVKQRAGQPAPGFYVSTTATPADEGYPVWDQRRYWDASEIAYQALTPALKNLGVNQGDFGMAIRNDTGMYSGFFFADWGNKPKVGECSLWLFNTIFPNYPRENNERGVSYIVFPGSGIGPSGWEVPAKIHSAIAGQIIKLNDADNADELPLFLALGADLSRLKRTLKKLNDMDVRFPIAEYQRISWTLALLWYGTDGDFHPGENSPQLK